MFTRAILNTLSWPHNIIDRISKFLQFILVILRLIWMTKTQKWQTAHMWWLEIGHDQTKSLQIWMVQKKRKTGLYHFNGGFYFQNSSELHYSLLRFFCYCLQSNQRRKKKQTRICSASQSGIRSLWTGFTLFTSDLFSNAE